MTMQTMQIRINQELTKRLDSLVKTGIYQNRSEAIRDAVRRLVLKEMVGIMPDNQDSVKQIKSARKNFSKQKLNLDEINSLID
jgi:Arc/MetJ-type ribon-helix-helix transcriptional regulator